MMTCLEFRRRVGAEPAAADAEVVAHRRDCPACAHYQDELRAMDALIERALKVSLPAKPQAVAEDVVQESMLRAWKSFDSLTDESKAKAWLLTIVRRELARTYEKKRPELADVDALVAAESAALAAPEDERVEEMRNALFRLQEDYREPLVMQVLLGYSTKEIAEMMGMQQGAVLTRLFRARAQLRQQLGLAPEARP